MLPVAILVPLLSFGACVVSGITSFGDGVFFVMGWSFYRLANPDSDFTLQEAVLYTSILPLASMPALLFAARKELRASLGYAVVMTASSAALTPLGVILLVKSNPLDFSIVVGALFCLFSLAKLISTTLDFGLKRKESEADILCAANCLRRPTPHTEVKGETKAVDFVHDDIYLSSESEQKSVKPQLCSAETVLLQPATHWPCVQTRIDKLTCLQTLVCPFFPPICEYAVETVVLVICVSGCMSGFIGGLIGTSSPPQMVAFAQLGMTKGSIRGVKVLTSVVSNILRMVLLLQSDSSDIIMREWWLFLAMSIAAFLGAAIGSRIRHHLNHEVLLWSLYVILWFCGAQVMRVFSSTDNVSIIIFSCVTFLLCCTLYLCYSYPRCILSFGRTCRERVCAPRQGNVPPSKEAPPSPDNLEFVVVNPLQTSQPQT